MTRNLTKKLIILGLTTLMFLTLTSCNPKTNYLDNPIALVYKDHKPYLLDQNDTLFSLSQYDSIIPYFGDILIVKKNNHFGYLKNTGEPLTEIIYDEAYQFSENKAVVSLDQKFYLINEKGETIYQFDEGVSSQSSFVDNRLVISYNHKQGYLVYNEENNNYDYLINIETDDTVNHFPYDYCGSFSEGYAVVGTLNSENKLKYTHINENGTRLYDYEWDYANNFSEGYAVVGNYVDYNALIYCSDINTFDRDGEVAPAHIMGYMYINPYGCYIGETSNNPYIYAVAKDFKDGVAICARLCYYVSNYLRKWWNPHPYDLTNEDAFFYNYDFITKDGNHLFGDWINGNQNNWGGGSTSYYDSIVQLDNYYLSTYHLVHWDVKYASIDNLDYRNPFQNIEYDIKDPTIKDEVVELYPWISTYITDYCNNGIQPTYVIDCASQPFNLTSFKISPYFNDNYVAKVQIYSGKRFSCGLITVKITDDGETTKLNLTYLVPPLYDEIIF